MRSGTKILIAGGLVALFARAIAVNEDPTGNNFIDRGLSSLAQKVLPSKCNKFKGESSHTLAVCDALFNSASRTNFLNYSNQLVGTTFKNNDRPDIAQVLKMASTLRANPRGDRPNPYTEDELRGFYLYLSSAYNNSDDNTMPYQPLLADFAAHAYQVIENNCHSNTAPPHQECHLK